MEVQPALCLGLIKSVAHYHYVLKTITPTIIIIITIIINTTTNIITSNRTHIVDTVVCPLTCAIITNFTCCLETANT